MEGERMLEVEKVEQWRGEDVVDREGEKIGKLDDVFLDASSGEPGIASIKAGFLGRKSVLVPLEGAILSREFLRLAISKEQFDDAPKDPGERGLDRDSEVALFHHYDLDPPADSDREREGPRYEAAGAREERGEEASELRAEAAKLEEEAEKRDEEAGEAGSKAERARERESSAASERDDAGARAEELRRKADDLER